MFTRSHLETIARDIRAAMGAVDGAGYLDAPEAIAGYRNGVAAVARRLAGSLAAGNARFDPARFYAAAGVESSGTYV